MSKSIKAMFFENIDLSSVRNIHCYLPIISKKEIDTFLIIDEILEKMPGKKVFVPKVVDSLMHTLPYLKGGELVIDELGISYPKNTFHEDIIPDLVIIPLLAFDVKGYRVGYGGGYYDKYLSTLPRSVQNVGLSFFPSIETISDLDEFDIPLDYCISPDKFYEFDYM